MGAAAAVVAVLAVAGCTSSDAHPRDDGYERLGTVDGYVVLATPPRPEDDGHRFEIRMRRGERLMCDASGPVTLKLMVCDGTVGDERALALAVPAASASVVVDMPSGALDLDVLPTPSGWSVTVAAAVISDREFEGVTRIVARDAAGRVLGDG